MFMHFDKSVPILLSLGLDLITLAGISCTRAQLVALGRVVPHDGTLTCRVPVRLFSVTPVYSASKDGMSKDGDGGKVNQFMLVF